MLFAFVAALGLAGSQAPVAASPPAAEIAHPLANRLDRFIRSQPEGREFSGAVLVARADSILLRKGYGLANVEHSVANTPHTPFKIGSLTKQFTAAAILILADRKALGLEDPICRYIDDCPPSWSGIRIANLLDHSSGIVDIVRLPGFEQRMTQPTNLEKTIALLRAQPPQFAVGSDARYGNSGLIIAARIIEKVSGKSYDRFLADNIYTPLGMRNSGYAWDDKIIPGRAAGYVRDGIALKNARFIDMSLPMAAGSQYSSVDDMFAWDRALHGGKLFSPALVARMFTPNPQGYGLGWEVDERFGRKVYAHNGDINGFGSYVARYPSDGVYVIVLSNIERTDVRRINDGLAAIALEAGP